MKNENLLQKEFMRIHPLDESWFERAQTRLDSLTKPRGSLGRLEELAQKICAIMENEKPWLEKKSIFVLAADHGVAKEGVSAYPQDVTWQMVLNFLRGGAGINVLARAAAANVVVVDMGIAKDFPPESGLVIKKIRRGTSSFLQGPAMTREEAARCISTGIQLVEDEIKRGLDIVGTGDMGIGNTTASSAITAVVTRKSVAEVTGRGTGIETDALARKVHAIERALEVNQPDANDAMDVLSKVGGFEIGGLAGVILGAVIHRIPVVLDGFISGAAALIAVALAPSARPYLIASHRSAEPGHDAALSFLGLEPYLDLQLRLGEGTGAALGLILVDASCRILNEMATFEEAGVSDKE